MEHAAAWERSEVIVADSRLDSKARAGRRRCLQQLTEPTAESSRCTATGCSGPFRMPRTPYKRPCSRPGRASGVRGRSSLRTWLYQIATNRCLNARRSASRRPAKEWDVPKVNRRNRPVWAKSSGWSPTGRPPRGCYRRAARPRGPLRADRVHLPGLRDRPPGAAAPPARRTCLARCPRISRERGGRHAGLDRRIGQQRA